jgi:hypothetical protein
MILQFWHVQYVCANSPDARTPVPRQYILFSKFLIHSYYPLYNKVVAESIHINMKNNTILKDIKCFQIWAYFEGIGINFNFENFKNKIFPLFILRTIQSMHARYHRTPQIHWSIIFMVFIRIPLQFLTFQWKRSVSKPTLDFWQMLQEPLGARTHRTALYTYMGNLWWRPNDCVKFQI